ncbi:hypothetical protein DsansV1_C29g0208001 [Dioscorea sansibarensis]
MKRSPCHHRRNQGRHAEQPEDHNEANTGYETRQRESRRRAADHALGSPMEEGTRAAALVLEENESLEQYLTAVAAASMSLETEMEVEVEMGSGAPASISVVR